MSLNVTNVSKVRPSNFVVVTFSRGMPIAPFCSKVKQDPLETECTNDRSSVALCNLLEHSEQLPRMFQNFDEIYNVDKGREGFYGGSVSLADYCPYIQEFTWRSKSVVVRGSNCRYVENNPRKLIKTWREFLSSCLNIHVFF